MKATFFISLTALLAPVAVLAQGTDTTTATSSSSTCLADYIVEQCLTTTETNQENCDQQDYSCQCAAYQAIVTCFNNCPGDVRQSTYQGLVTQYCALASQYSTTNTVRATATSAGVSGSTGTASATATGTATKSGTNTESTAQSNSGAQLIQGASSLMAGVAGVVAALL